MGLEVISETRVSRRERGLSDQLVRTSPVEGVREWKGDRDTSDDERRETPDIH